MSSYAFGKNEYHGECCPALSAGMDPDGRGKHFVYGLREAAEMYDSQAEKFKSGYVGVINEEKAREAWIAAMQEIENDVGKDSDQYQAARKVADKLGWVGDSE